MTTHGRDASESGATLQVRLRAETTSKLVRLAQRTRRSPSVLADAAVTAYIDHELDILDGIDRGLADLQAGCVIPHDDAMRRIRATIAREPAMV